MDDFFRGCSLLFRRKATSKEISLIRQRRLTVNNLAQFECKKSKSLNSLQNVFAVKSFLYSVLLLPLYAPLLKFLFRRSTSKLFESYIPTTCVEQILDLLLIPLPITIPSKDLAAAKAIERAATHRISRNFIILSTKKRFYQVRFLCAQTGRDLR